MRAVSEGRCHGVIVKELRGTGGFGYDPLFLVPEFHKTFVHPKPAGQARAFAPGAGAGANATGAAKGPRDRPVGLAISIPDSFPLDERLSFDDGRFIRERVE